MRITWYGHACFMIESGGSSVVIDPYDDSEGLFRLQPLKLSADAVICSHEHSDHNNRDAVNLTGKICRLKIESVPSFHDNLQGRHLGDNLIHIISDGDFRAAHFGDLGHELSNEQLAAVGQIDVMMVNIGGFIFSQAALANALANAIRPTVIIPMHYRSEEFGYIKMGTLQDFAAFRKDLKYYDANYIEITRNIEQQTAVLNFIKK